MDGESGLSKKTNFAVGLVVLAMLTSVAVLGIRFFF